ncbi:MAG TPA: Holliday junction branch migration protein RuvA [Bdellovibrionota bacterium]|jgi:Holliday junction DNA helicase RuvA
MIARLKGLLEEKNKDGVVIDVQGVGYGLHVPETVFLRLPDLGGEVSLFVHTHVREDHITLYGFLSKLEKDTFEILMTASGVGPKLALTILSNLEAGQLLEAVSAGNKMLFNGISGVGKKTVEKLFVEIREKAEKRLNLERGGEETTSGAKKKSSSVSASVSWVNDLEQALLGMGYRDNDVRLALREIAGHDSTHKDFDTAFKNALKYLSGGVRPQIRGNA